MDDLDLKARRWERIRKFYIGIIMIIFACLQLIILIKINNYVQMSHQSTVRSQDTVIENEQKIDTNLRNSLKCVLLLTPTTYNAQAVNNCLAVHEVIIK